MGYAAPPISRITRQTTPVVCLLLLEAKTPALRETVQRLQQAGEELLDEGLFGIRDQTVVDLQRITDEEFESCQWTMTE